MSSTKSGGRHRSILEDGMQDVPILSAQGPARRSFHTLHDGAVETSNLETRISPRNRPPSYLRQFLTTNWFILALIITIVFAKMFPYTGISGGMLKPEFTIKIMAVFLIFFLSGLTMKTDDITKTVFKMHVHLLIQLYSFVATPMLVYIMLNLVEGVIDKTILQGVLTVACMPPPVSSAVLLTKSIGGDEPVAIFNAVVGSLLGLVITPLNLLYYLGYSSSVPASMFITQLSLTVVFPLILGQFLRYLMGDVFRPWKEKFNVIGSFMLLAIIYNTFCDTFVMDTLAISWTTLVKLLALELFMQGGTLFLFFYAFNTRKKWFSPEDVIAAMFSAQHKSLTIGMPILTLMFSGESFLSSLTIPLLMYHPLQIIVGSLLIEPLKAWLEAETRRRRRQDV